MTICWERAVVTLAFHLYCFYFSAVLVVRVPFPLGIWGRMWNSVVSVPDHCLLIHLCTRMRIVFINPSVVGLRRTGLADSYTYFIRAICIIHKRAPKPD